MNALKLSAARRRNQVVILHCLQSKPTPLSTPKRALSSGQLLKAAGVLAAVVALSVCAGLAAADVMAAKIALCLCAIPVVYFCVKGGDK